MPVVIISAVDKLTSIIGHLLFKTVQASLWGWARPMPIAMIYKAQMDSAFEVHDDMLFFFALRRTCGSYQFPSSTLS